MGLSDGEQATELKAAAEAMTKNVATLVKHLDAACLGDILDDKAKVRAQSFVGYISNFPAEAGKFWKSRKFVGFH